MSRWNDAPGVGLAEPPRGLEGEIDRPADRSGPVLLHQPRQVASLDILHDEEVQALELVGIERGDDVGVTQCAAAWASRWNRSTANLSIVNEGGSTLSADDPVHPPVPGLEHQAHAAGPDLVEDHVVADDQPFGLALEDGRGLVGGQPRLGPARGREPRPLTGGQSDQIGRGTRRARRAR